MRIDGSILSGGKMSAELKLSEAIRKGSAIRPQAIYDYFDSRTYNNIGLPTGEGLLSSCVMGAAYEGMGGSPLDTREDITDALVDQWPALNGPGERASLPCDCPPLPPLPFRLGLFRACTHLNTYHQWDRGRIADWLEGKGL